MAAVDRFSPNSAGMSTPLSRGEAVTAHDSNEQTFVSRAVWVGGAGNITALMADGSTVLFTGVPAGTLLPIRAKRINNTGTSATNMTFLD